MSRMQREVITASTGYDTSADPIQLTPNRAQAINNALLTRKGKLLGQVQLVNVLGNNFISPIDSVLYYNGENNYQDRLLLVSAGLSTTSDFLYETAWQGVETDNFSGIPFTPPYPPLFDTPVQSQTPGNLLGVGQIMFSYVAPPATPARVRANMFNTELIIAASNGQFGNNEHSVGNFRYYIPNQTTPDVTGVVYPLGLFAPGTTTGNLNPITNVEQTGTITAPAGKGIGTYSYCCTWFDEMGRESDLSPQVQITTTEQNSVVTVTFNTNQLIPGINGNPWIGGINLYVNTLGDVTTFYQIANFPAASYFPGTYTYIDSQSDSVVSSLFVGPSPGENAVANPASLIAIFQNRVVLNDLTNVSTIQISGLNNPVQFSVTNYVPTDGVVYQIDNNQGNPITALCNFGSYLVILRQSTIHILQGTDPTNFDIQQIATRGCIATDSVVQYKDILIFLSDDGIWYLDPFLQTKKLSLELIDDLEHFYDTTAGQNLLAASVGWIDNSRYHLHVDYTTYVREFQAAEEEQGGGWYTYRFSPNAIGLINNIPTGSPQMEFQT